MNGIGLTDSKGQEIKAGDVLIKHYPGVEEVTEEQWAETQRRNPHTSFGLGFMPHAAIPPSSIEHVVEWDASMAQWSLPRDYDGAPDLAGWEVKSV